jgi:hypothetical protein
MIIPVIISLVSLLVIVWAIFAKINDPFPGFEWSAPSNYVESDTDEMAPYISRKDLILTNNGDQKAIIGNFNGKISL